MKVFSKFVFTIAFLPFFFLKVSGQINSVEPPSWWVGMKSNKLQLMIHGENVASKNVSINYPGIVIITTHKTNNANYLFVDLELTQDLIPGELKLEFWENNNLTETFPYVFYKRDEASSERAGFNNSDVIYLVMPDRFANGNALNDNVDGMPDKLNRKDPYGRHGGDIKGLADNLDYIANMGFTAIWLNPVLENNQYEQSYHGYAITNFYKVDQRLGTNEEYREFSKLAKDKGIKLIKDLILNHCGSEHLWMKDMPSTDWINFYPDFKITNHRRTVNQDPYASEIDRELMTDGWFVPQMPDMNQRNSFLATYLIQNSIWWIEYANLAGLRVDTYPYPDKEFMSEWNQKILDEYPNLNIVGEEWSPNPAIVSYWQKGQKNRDGYQSNLPSVMDFPLQIALKESMLEEEKWEHGLNKLYDVLANDFLYSDPFNLVIFPDNHDMSRFFVQVNENINLYKLGMAFILTTRGIPQIYYGSEILMTHLKNDGHGNIRKEFPGGWPDHRTNAFTGKNLKKEQKETQEFFRVLLNWRKKSPQIHEGKLIHFAPEDGIYVYFRYLNDKMTMIVLNKNKTAKEINVYRFHEVLKSRKSGKEIITGREINLTHGIIIPGLTPFIIDLN